MKWIYLLMIAECLALAGMYGLRTNYTPMVYWFAIATVNAMAWRMAG